VQRQLAPFDPAVGPFDAADEPSLCGCRGAKKADNFFSDSFLKGDFPYFCSPFWGLFLLSSVG
jgi:hypothetical protein